MSEREEINKKCMCVVMESWTHNNKRYPRSNETWERGDMKEGVYEREDQYLP